MGELYVVQPVDFDGVSSWTRRGVPPQRNFQRSDCRSSSNDTHTMANRNFASRKAAANARFMSRRRIPRRAPARKLAVPRRRFVGRPLAQGTGAAVRRAFGSSGIPSTLRAWDATSPSHLALPRATGPYTVIRTTRLINTTALFGFAGAFADMSAGGVGALEHMAWADTTWIEDAAPGPINAVAGTTRYSTTGINLIGPAATLVPAAITMQVMCPEPLQTASGIVYIGRSHAQLDLANDTRTWNDLGNEFVSFMAPRLCSAAKLALRGVKVSSYPLDMSALADFRSPDQLGNLTFTWNETQRFGPEGFAPLVVYNPNNVSLQLLITVEWRVRFDIANVAASTHRTYPPTTDKVWSALSSAAHKMGHGVVDIVEDVAIAGAEGAAVAGAIAAV